MKESTDKKQESQKEVVQQVSKESSNGGTAQLQDNRSATSIQHKLQDSMGTSSESNALPIQRKNNTGLPDNLKSGIENLSGYSMDDVKVHYNSSKPAQLQAHAYAQGTDIHLGSGQEKHLPHEAWHVVQQKQGRVQPTRQLKSKVNINDDAGLENEADVMGEKALSISKITQRRNIFVENPKIGMGTNIDFKNNSKLPIQRVPIPTTGGAFEEVRFESNDRNVSSYRIRGVSIILKFTPNANFGENGDRISLVQTVKDDLIYTKQPYLNGQKTTVQTPNWKENKTAAFAGRRTPNGWALDQQVFDEKGNLSNLDPRYAEERLVKGLHWKVPMTPKQRDEIKGERYGGYLQGESNSALKTNGVWNKAVLSDEPNSKATNTNVLSGSMNFQVAALFEPVKGDPQWLGSVSWGWSINPDNGKVVQISLAEVTQEGLSPDFTEAKSFWNAQKIEQNGQTLNTLPLT